MFQSKLNCEVLYDELAFEVRWAVAGDSIVLQLVAKLDDREYMSFGISGDDSKSEMIGGDVVVAWVDKTTLKGHAEDYHLGAKSQCSGPTGSCPDNKFRENSNNIRLLNAAMVNGYSIVTYQRPLKPSDEYDRQIHTNRSQAIIWAVGPLNQREEVSFHSDYTKGDQFLEFGRPAKWNCPMPESEQPPMKVETTTQKSRNTERRRGNNNNKKETDNTSSASRTRQTERKNSTNTRRGSTAVRTVPTPAPVSKREAWEIPPIKCYEPEDGVYYAQMGPTGGKRGYPAITGHVGWGISWYINGLLIPEINVVRGKTYTFVVEGGSDPEIAAKYHPFYITDDSIGGYEYKTEEERKKVKIFAGAFAAKDGSVKPTGTGRLCHWTHQGDLDADDFESFGAYQRTLELKCDQGEPGVIQWTPDKNTPDTVYYQCFTHRYLGWKINVHDTCDEQAEASEPEASVVPAPDLEESPSIRIETMVKPNQINVEDKEDKNKTVSERIIRPVTHHQSPTILPTSVYLPLLNAHPYVFDYPVYTQAPLHSFESSFLDSVSSEAPPNDSALLSTDAIISTEKLQTPSITEKLIVATTDAKPINQSFFVPHMFRNKFVVRRPVRKPMPLNMRPPYFKKPIYRPMKVRLPAPRDPLHPSETQIKTRRPGLIIVKPIKKAPLSVKNVQVSPQQASTEKVTPSPIDSESYFLKPAKNTGFKPESIVMETGFKPIISKEMTKTGPQLSSEGEIGMIDRKVKIVKHDVEEPEAAAAERVESYYLPPQGTKPQITQRQQASNIDFESPKLDLGSPPDVVVTYDGKRVSGASLTAKAADRSSILDVKASKAAELIKARPQFAPFKGDLPPLNPEIINRRVPQLENRGVINRNPETPPRSFTRLRQV